MVVQSRLDLVLRSSNSEVPVLDFDALVNPFPKSDHMQVPEKGHVVKLVFRNILDCKLQRQHEVVYKIGSWPQQTDVSFLFRRDAESSPP